MTSTRHLSVAFLRGINVGGHRVKMDRLRAILVDLGIVDPQTFIASGNVVFDRGAATYDALEARLEDGLAEALGYEVATFMRSLEHVSHVAAAPAPAEFGATGHGGHYVAFLKRAAPPEVRADVMALSSGYDGFVFADRELHWFMHGRLSDSPLFGGAFERALAPVGHTLRKVTTLRRLVARFGPSDAG